MRILCYDIGGTDTKYGVVEDGKIIFKDKFKTEACLGHDNYEKRLLEYGQKVIDNYEGIEGVAVGVCGSVNIETGDMFLGQECNPELLNFNFKQLFKQHFNLKCIADNDVNTFSQAERYYGAGKEYGTYFVITIGTGIGGAVIVNNRIWRGRNFNAGEVGRIPIFNDDVTWENKASVTALLEEARRRKASLKVENGKDVFDLYDNNDPTAKQIVTNWFDNLGRGLAVIVYTFNPEVIVIGGGISQRETLFKELEEATKKHLVPGFKDTFKIIPAKFLNDGGLIGAYCNYLEYYNQEHNK